ncbi:hypothetical protein ACFL4D_02180 [Candidatus Margulisiibacteriota bacterium]
MLSRFFIVVLSFFLLIPINGIALERSLSGQLSGWFVLSEPTPDKTLLGVRYLPELRVGQQLSADQRLDMELALNFYSSSALADLNYAADSTFLKPYRASLRYTTDQLEVRAGLQKISFGPAMVLRSLMWFDRLDPRDPLKLTDGVYGLLARYFFLDNSNVWAWTLYGNEDPKGLETIGTYSRSIEVGGRWQFPVPAGELALTYHRRRPAQDSVESRYAIDGSWDFGVGIWFEAVLSETEQPSAAIQQTKLFTIGSDYTFDWGTGLRLLAEHMIRDQEDLGLYGNYSALNGSYNLSMIDTINVIIYYDWKQENIDSYLSWQSTYDEWLLNISAYESGMSSGGLGEKGVQVLVRHDY